MEWLLTKLVSAYHLVEQVSNWAACNPGPAFFFGAVFWALLNTVVKLSPTSADDIVVDIIARAFMAGWNKAFKR
jgi:hypothetical protein